MAGEKIKIVLVDDHQMLIDGIKSLLSGAENFEVIAEFTSAKKLLEQIKELNPYIVITDINMPEMSGIELTLELKKNYPFIKILALSMHGDKAMISKMIDAGVSGYILKNTGKAELLEALTQISSGNVFYSHEVANELIHAKQNISNEVNLTPREVEIIQLIAKEKSNAQIADELSISERTVETHRKNIFRKTNTKSVIGLVKFAMEKGIV
ncbi:MAG: response regulator transcription factor [Bacteroidota bacterium]